MGEKVITGKDEKEANEAKAGKKRKKEAGRQARTGEGRGYQRADVLGRIFHALASSNGGLLEWVTVDDTWPHLYADTWPCPGKCALLACFFCVFRATASGGVRASCWSLCVPFVNRPFESTSYLTYF